MAYRLGPVIGKFGGAEGQKFWVEGITDGGKGSEVIMHTVHVPEGETWLVVLSGELAPRYTHSSGPILYIGDVRIGPALPAGRTFMAAKVTGTAEIKLRRNTANNDDAFYGYIYIAPSRSLTAQTQSHTKGGTHG